MRLSDDDYVTFEGVDTAVPVRITKDSTTRLANPVIFRVTPLTVDDALAQGVIDYFEAEEGLTEEEIERSPLRASKMQKNSFTFYYLSKIFIIIIV